MSAEATEPALGAPQGAEAGESAALFDRPARWLRLGWAAGETDDRHSRRVALLKRVLPAIAVALLLLIAVWPRLVPLWERMRFAFPPIDLREARELQMVNPRYSGVDRTGRPFLVTAAVGRQVPDRQDLMSLQSPRADVKTHAGADVVVTAATGVYQSQTQLLDLFGRVMLVHQNGTTFLTQTARVDAAKNTAQGSDPVEGHGPSGDVKAEGFRILDKGDTIVFTGKTDLLAKAVRPAAAKGSPVGLPAPVAAAARRTEAEGKPLLAAARPAPKTAPAHKTQAATGKPPARAKPAAKKN